MPSPVFRSAAHASSGGTSDTVTIAKPSGTIDDDVMLATLYAEPDTQAITGPAGWTSFAMLQNAGYPFKMELFWKRAAGEGASYDFTETGNAWGGGSIASFSGCVASGSPIDAFGADNTGSGTAVAALGITTLTVDTLLLFINCIGDGSKTMSVVPSGMTSHYEDQGNGNTYLFTQAIAAAGAIGTKTGTLSATDQWAAVLVALSSGGAAGGGAKARPVFQRRTRMFRRSF